MAPALQRALRPAVGPVSPLLRSHRRERLHSGIDLLRHRGVCGAFDPTVAIPAEDAAALEAVGIEPDVLLRDGDERWGVGAIGVPGHTPGNTSFLHAETDTLLVGDTFVHRNSVVAAPGDWSGAFAPVAPALNDDDAAARRNIGLLAGRSFDAARLTHGLNVLEGAGREFDMLLDDLGLA